MVCFKSDRLLVHQLESFLILSICFATIVQRQQILCLVCNKR